MRDWFRRPCSEDINGVSPKKKMSKGSAEAKGDMANFQALLLLF